MSDITGIVGLNKLQELGGLGELGKKTSGDIGGRFAESLQQAIESVDAMQKESEAAQASYARGEEVDLHDVLIRVEEAEMAFKTMMEVRNKLVDAYREVMRMGG